MTTVAQKHGSSERGCRFHSKMRIWCFSRLLLSIKLLKCFGNNNKNPVKYISRCFYGKFPRQLLSEKKKFKLQNNPVILKAQRSPVRLNAALCEVCAAPQVDELGAFLHLTFLLPRAFLYALEVRQRRAAEDTENEKKTRTTSKQATGRWPLVLCGFGWPCPSLGPKQEFKQLGKATGPHCAHTCRNTRDTALHAHRHVTVTRTHVHSRSPARGPVHTLLPVLLWTSESPL